MVTTIEQGAPADAGLGVPAKERQHLGRCPTVERRRLHRDQHKVGGEQGRAHESGDARRSVDDDMIDVARQLGRFTVQRIARQPDDAARATDREPMLRRQDVDHLTTRGGRYSFRPSTSLMAAFSSARSAYIRLSFAFSASSCFSRRISVGNNPSYFFFQLK